MFLTAFLVVLAAQSKVYVVILVAALLVRFKILAKAEVKALSTAIVSVFLPCLIFSNITETFRPFEIPNWFVLPLVAIALSASGLLAAWFLFRKELAEKRNFLPIASMQNAGYLALPLGQMLFPDRFDQYALYVFLMILGLSPFLWSVGKRLSTGVHHNGSRWPGFLNPPFVANILAIILVLVRLNYLIPSFLLETVKTLGTATVPLANFVLGAIIGGISLRCFPSFKDVVRVLSVKFLLMPILMILVLSLTGISRSDILLEQTFIIQAASPPATAIMLQINRYGGDEQRAGSMMILSLIVCLPAIPFWLAVWNG